MTMPFGRRAERKLGMAAKRLKRRKKASSSIPFLCLMRLFAAKIPSSRNQRGTGFSGWNNDGRGRSDMILEDGFGLPWMGALDLAQP
jgi:hypothetical protein